MKEINLNSKIVLLEALEHIDRDLIGEFTISKMLEFL